MTPSLMVFVCSIGGGFLGVLLGEWALQAWNRRVERKYRDAVKTLFAPYTPAWMSRHVKWSEEGVPQLSITRLTDQVLKDPTTGKLVPHDCGGTLCSESSIDGGTLRCETCDGDRSGELSPQEREEMKKRLFRPLGGTCRACAHSYMEPDSGLICGHSDSGEFGLTIHSEPLEHCGWKKFLQHPLRSPEGHLKP